MTEVWNNLVRQRGRRVVMNASITDDQLDAETSRQIPILRDAIRPLLRGCEKTALDFGCGYGRFTPMLANLIDGRAMGFDPSSGMVSAARWHQSVDYVSCPTDQFFHEIHQADTQFDLILAFAVLGEPSMPVRITALNLCNALAPGGLLVVVEHIVPNPDPTRWWRFQQPGFYEGIFRTYSVHLEEVGKVPQLGDTMTILAGRFTRPPV